MKELIGMAQRAAGRCKEEGFGRERKESNLNSSASSPRINARCCGREEGSISMRKLPPRSIALPISSSAGAQRDAIEERRGELMKMKNAFATGFAQRMTMMLEEKEKKIQALSRASSSFSSSSPLLPEKSSPLDSSKSDLALLPTTGSLRTLKTLFAAILEEKRIALSSSNISKLSQCVLALSLPPFPLIWPHALISLAPPKLLDALSAPAPCIVGAPSSSERDINFGELDQVAWADLRSSADQAISTLLSTILAIAPLPLSSLPF